MYKSHKCRDGMSQCERPRYAEICDKNHFSDGGSSKVKARSICCATGNSETSPIFPRSCIYGKGKWSSALCQQYVNAKAAAVASPTEAEAKVMQTQDYQRFHDEERCQRTYMSCCSADWAAAFPGIPQTTTSRSPSSCSRTRAKRTVESSSPGPRKA